MNTVRLFARAQSTMVEAASSLVRFPSARVIGATESHFVPAARASTFASKAPPAGMRVRVPSVGASESHAAPTAGPRKSPVAL